MSWRGIEGHDPIVERFRRSAQRGRLGSSYLLIGPPGVGKRLFCVRLAQALMCSTRPEPAMDPCLECPACQQIAAATHPDVEFVQRPPGASVIPIELLIGDREHRMREGLCHRISLRPSTGRRRVAVIDDADYLNPAGANCLLKTLEEPPPGAVLLLIGTSLQRQLPTIRSRCQIVRFNPLDDDVVRRYVAENRLAETPEQAERLVELAEGSFERARVFADVELADFMRQLNDDWSRRPASSVRIAHAIRQFVERAGSDAPKRRARLRQIVELTMRRLRHELRRSTVAAVAGADEPPPADSHELSQIDRCLEAFQQIDANANLATLIECWVDDLRI